MPSEIRYNLYESKYKTFRKRQNLGDSKKPLIAESQGDKKDKELEHTENF